MKYVPPLGAGTLDAPYIDGNPEYGIEGSPVPARSIEHPQREIVRAITGAGLTPDGNDLTQLAKAIGIIAASGRAQKSWRIATAIASGGVLTLPQETIYTVGGGALLLAWDNILLDAENYMELGEAGQRSTAVQLLFDAPAGSRFWAAMVASGGGALGVSFAPPDLLEHLAASIDRAENAAAQAENAIAAVGDPLFVNRNP